MLGKLTWAAIPFDQPIPLVAAGFVGVILLGVLGWIVVRGHLPYLWREWITSVDHKRIGVMYAARFLGRVADALAAGAGLPGAGLPAA